MAEYNRGDVFSTNCDACIRIGNKAVVASYICKDCTHFLCDECYTFHRKTVPTMGHLVLRLDRPAKQRDVKGKQDSHQDDQPSTLSGSKNEGQTRKAKVKPFFAEYERVGRETKIVGSSDADLDEYKDGKRQRHGVKQAEVSGRKVKYDQNVRGRYGDQDQTVTNSMKNMNLNAHTTRHTGNPYTTATLKHSLNVKRENDKLCCFISGLVVLQDKIIVCDCSNSKLKVYDSSYRFLYDNKYDDKPYNIDMLDVNTVVVSSTLGRNMRLLSVGNDSMKEIRKINTEYGCYGVCCYEGKIYCIVKDLKDSRLFSEVRVYAHSGRLEHTFEHLSDGKVEYNNLQYITVNPQTGILYVTDVDQGVLALSTSGDVIDVMSPPQLKDPLGIDVDDLGHIYVCGFGSDNVIQMSPDGGSIVEILSGEDKCKFPKCVKIYGNKMCVSHVDPKSYTPKVSIYQLS